MIINFNRILSLILIMSFFALFLLFSLFWYFSSDLPDFAFLKTYKPAVSTKVYDINGDVIADFSREKRSFINIDQVPKKVISAFLSAEDKNFYKHPGIDAIGITRAVFKNIKNIISGKRLEGASTITQQVAKNFLLNSDVSLARKVKEAILAFRLEKSLSKKRILELYLNEIYLGERSYGIASASMTYFNKSIKDINFSEAALLAALPKAPSKYNPYRNYNTVEKRKNWVLNRMYENNFITKKQFEQSLNYNIKLKKRILNIDMSPAYFVEEIRKNLIEKYGEKKIYKQGLYIKTSLNKKIQRVATDSLNKNLIKYSKRHGWVGPLYKGYSNDKFIELVRKKTMKSNKYKLALVKKISDNRVKILTEKKENGFILFKNVKWAKKRITQDLHKGYPKKMSDVFNEGDVIYVKKINKLDHWSLEQVPIVNGAVVVMNPWSGRVLALSGGFDFTINQFNRATQAERQPGSAFKPFVYATALENNYKPNSIVLDAPFVIYQNKNEYKWKPKNYTGRFYGKQLFRYGIEKSNNLMTVRIANDVGLSKINKKAKELDIYKNTANILSSSLGSGETTLIKITSAYGSFVNGGKKINPTLIDLIQDRNGNTIYKNDKLFCLGCRDEFNASNPPVVEDRYIRVFNEDVSYQMVNILKGVVQRGTGKKLKKLKFELAGKTGTTNENLDAWFIGFTPELLIGVFIGFDEPSTLGKKETGSKAALPVFADIMQQLKPNNFVPFFKSTETVKFAKINARTGRKTFSDKNTINESFKLNTIIDGYNSDQIMKEY
ncbi:MAG: penicillin-binding protein [Candidatus Pelagibacter sp.]|nr:penicillin-binding protein [Candidatus Pelagibacter sp.]OUV87366.1 MAG: penicillin-binding protein [Pelagibacteraceae bacterium TMED136]